jgi:type I restriction enzyme, S subunit
MSGLPEGWAETTLGDIATLRGEKTSPASVPDAPFIGLEDIEPNTSRILKVGKGSDVKSAVAMFSAGDVLYSRLRPYLNKVAVAEFDGIASAEILVIQPTEVTTAEFVRRRIMTPEFLDFAALLDKGDRPRVNYPEISRFPIALPPLPEQKRIVAKVDGLTARTARARADLARIPTLIARYKQRLLALAFSGDAEPQLPLERLVSEGLIGLVRSKEEQSAVVGVPYIRMQHYDLEGRWNAKDLTFVKATSAEANRFALRKGDLLFNTRNSVELVGKVALCPAEVEGYLFNNNILRIRFTPDVLPEFAFRQMQAPVFRGHLEGQKSATTSVAALYQRNLYQTPLWVPPVEQQTEIARRIESAFNWLDRVAADHAAAAKLLPKLDAAILAKAFRGELVPQDPTDEPATLLLARINQLSGAPTRKLKQVAVLPPPPPTSIAYLDNGGSKRGVAGEEVGKRVPDSLPPPPQEIRVIYGENDIATLPSRGGIPLVSAGAVSMTKSRQDDDVIGKPYLADLIKAGRGNFVQELFKASKLPVADFYKQLAWEIAHKHIRDDDEKLEAL